MLLARSPTPICYELQICEESHLGDICLYRIVTFAVPS